MKKSLVLAMAMALGVTASAYAANPFSDVPAGHWAYDSIDKLAAAGVIDGMGDGTYQGDKTMTRYEMAQIVAKAMAKGANVDKLAAEFADELDNLGVRVANLEKKADNVKITGAINLYTLAGHAKNNAAGVAQSHKYTLRSDLTIAGQINEDWKYTALLRNEQKFDNKYAGAGEEGVNFQRAWVDGRVGGLKVKAGRFQKAMANAEIWNTRIDGVEVAYGPVTVGYAQLSDAQDLTKAATPYYGQDAKVTYIEAKAKVGVVGLKADYYMFKDMTAYRAGGAALAEVEDNNIFAATITAPVVKNIGLTATYLHSEDTIVKDGQGKDGYTVKLQYKGAKAAKAGSFGIYAKYVDLPASTQVSNTYTTNSMITAATGMEGWQVGANYVFAKNITGTVEWYDFKENDAAQKRAKNQTLFAGLTFAF